VRLCPAGIIIPSIGFSGQLLALVWLPSTCCVQVCTNFRAWSCGSGSDSGDWSCLDRCAVTRKKELKICRPLSLLLWGHSILGARFPISSWAGGLKGAGTIAGALLLRQFTGHLARLSRGSALRRPPRIAMRNWFVSQGIPLTTYRRPGPLSRRRTTAERLASPWQLPTYKSIN